MIDETLVARAPRARADAGPSGHARHGAEPDVFFQAARRCNRFYLDAPDDRPATRWTASPRSPAAQYQLFDYDGAPDAERVIVMMGSGAETVASRRSTHLARAARRSAW